MATISRTGITNGGTIDADHVTRIIDALDGTGTATVVATGSFTGSLIGTVTGTGSYATQALSSSFAVSASIAASATSASIATSATTATSATSASIATSASFAISGSRAVSASYAVTASYAVNASSFPYTGSAQITGSLGVIGTTTISGSVDILTTTPNTLKGSIIGDSNLKVNFSEIAKTGGIGLFVLPIYEPASPVIGTVYIRTLDPPELNVWDGSSWRTLTFT